MASVLEEEKIKLPRQNEIYKLSREGLHMKSVTFEEGNEEDEEGCYLDIWRKNILGRHRMLEALEKTHSCHV